ncbi:hypothetical protein PtB15_3B258 [Puccinia triticina]|nr:hypothetical protein PtB15_3B258 [Puccinia triticina]
MSSLGLFRSSVLALKTATPTTATTPSSLPADQPQSTRQAPKNVVVFARRSDIELGPDDREGGGRICHGPTEPIRYSRAHPVTPYEVLEAVDLIVAACAEWTSKVQDSTGFICTHALAFNVSSAICTSDRRRPHSRDSQASRHSLALDTGKSAEELPRELNSEKHMGPNTLPALITHSTDEMFKSSSHLTECILEPSSSRSFFGDQSPFSHAFETGMDFRTFLQLSLMVDLGGEVGHVALSLARTYPRLRIVLQDRAEVIVQAQAAVSSKRVILEAHNLFDIQNRRGVRVFFARFVLREWNDETAVKILKNLSEVSSSSTKMILVETRLIGVKFKIVRSKPGRSSKMSRYLNMFRACSPMMRPILKCKKKLEDH